MLSLHDMKKSFHASFISNNSFAKKGGVKQSKGRMLQQNEDIMVHFVQPDNINLGEGDSDEDDDGSDEEDFEDYERRVSGHFNSGNAQALITSNFPAYQLSTDMRDDYDDGAMGITKRKTDGAKKKKKEESKSVLLGAEQTPGKNRKKGGARSSNATDL